MRGRLLRYLFLPLCLAVLSPSLRAHEKRDSLARLVSAQSAQLIEEGSVQYRKVIGPARFLHNGTYLVCDTALWNVNTNIIDAIGHVQLIQDRTRLTSQTLQYVVDDDLAKFRGSLVQLEDKDHNILRTKYLDYNTKDSVAIFQNGGAMRDKDGQIIESQYGSYDGKAGLFIFNDEVNMFTDSAFVRTSRLEYNSELSKAYFGYATDMWQKENMLSANAGWYDRANEVFFFRRNVHVMTKAQEAWSDTLYYYRAPNDVEMLGHVELLDTTRNVTALAGRFEYTDSLSKVRMTRNPAVVSIMEQNEKKDTVFFGGDTLTYRSIPRCDVPEAAVRDAEKRLNDLQGDPVMEYRRAAAEAAAKAAEEAAKNDPNRPPDRKTPGNGSQPGGTPAQAGKKGTEPPVEPGTPATPPRQEASRVEADTLAPLKTPEDSLRTSLDSLATPVDSLSVLPVVDSLSAVTSPSDTLSVTEPPKDTTATSFLWATGHVKLFRRDAQFSCDSLSYNDLDSLVRLYRDPLIFNEGNRQYAADSIYLAIRNRRLDKAHLMSNAFVTTEEEENCYDQIKGTEMVAYFDSTSVLTRFDALGGAAVLFYLQENDALATVNKAESKMLYATFVDGNLDKTYYFEDVKNNAFPVVQLPAEERELKGFRWNPERRPQGMEDITQWKERISEREEYLAKDRPGFKETNQYFPGYIDKIYKELARRDSLEAVRSRQKPAAEPPVEEPVADTLSVLPEAGPEGISDSLAVSILPPADSLTAVPSDSLVVPVDSLQTPVPVPADTLGTQTAVPEDPKVVEKRRKEEQKQQKAQERARIKAEKQAAREARWAEEDRKYEEKQAAKAAKKLQKERARKLRALRKLERKAQKEKRIFERYLEKERARKARREAKAAKRG